MDDKKWKKAVDRLNEETGRACDGGLDIMAVAADGSHVGIMGSISDGKSSERLSAALAVLLCDPNVGLDVGRIVMGAAMTAAVRDPRYMSLMREFLEKAGKKGPGTPKPPQGGRRMPS